MPLIDLPREILDGICDCLDNSCLKQLRVTCQLLYDVAARPLFHTVDMGFFLESLENLCSISEHPIYNELVRSLVVSAEPLQFLRDWDLAFNSPGPGCSALLPKGLTIEDLNLDRFRPFNTFVSRVPTSAITRTRPALMIGPKKGKKIAIFERFKSLAGACAFYNAEGERITYQSWLDLNLMWNQSNTQDNHALIQQHHRYVFEQISWPIIAARTFATALEKLPNLRHLQITSRYTGAYSEPFWEKMRPKLGDVHLYKFSTERELEMTQPAIDCLLGIFAGQCHNLQRLEVDMNIDSTFPERVTTLKSIIKRLKELRLLIDIPRHKKHLVRIEDGEGGPFHDLISSIKDAQSLEALNLGVTTWRGYSKPWTGVDHPLQGLTDAYWPCLRRLALTHTHFTQAALSQILTMHSATISSLDIKVCSFDQGYGDWSSFIASLPAMLPNLDWFWADDLSMDYNLRRGTQVLPATLYCPLEAAVRYQEYRRAVRAGCPPVDDSSLQIFDTEKWPSLCQEAYAAMMEEIGDNCAANDVPDMPQRDSESVFAARHYSEERQQRRRHYDGLRREAHWR